MRKFNDYGGGILRILIGALFVYSGFSKLIRPNEYFHAIIFEYQVVPFEFVPVVGLIVPWIEYIFGALFLVGLRTYWSGGIILGLAVAFQLILSQAILRELPLDNCGCFGAAFKLTLKQSFCFDSFLVLTLIFLITKKSQIYSLDSFFLKKNAYPK